MMKVNFTDSYDAAYTNSSRLSAWPAVYCLPLLTLYAAKDSCDKVV
jgi:hypothetical protein